MEANRKRQPKPHYQVKVLSSEEIEHKQFLLDRAPVNKELTELTPNGGIRQRYGIDYTIEGNILRWNDLGLDNFLEENERLELVYYIK